MLAYDNTYFERGFNYIAGADECGRGCLAGPVAAAAVILPRGCVLAGLDDSKKLSPKVREELFSHILEKALAVRVCMIDADEIDKINILRASLQAMGAAVTELPLRPEITLIDGRFLPDINYRMESVVKGDGKSLCIAAASVIAKVTRDALMDEYDKTYPRYGFGKNKGYPTAAHYQALKEYGPCPIHRRSFRLF